MAVAPITLSQTPLKKLITLIDIYLLKNDISREIIKICISDMNIINQYELLSTDDKIKLYEEYFKVDWNVEFINNHLTFNKILCGGR